MFKDVINLISITSNVNDVGDVIEITTERTIFVNKKSVRQSEFYQAAAKGLQPTLMFELRSIDYENEPKLSYNSKEYTIIRTYDKGEFTELICEGITNGE